MPVNDSWIAATAIAHDLAIVTRDHDFDTVEEGRAIRFVAPACPGGPWFQAPVSR
jgi:predicted nucleic acid-binding protein